METILLVSCCGEKLQHEAPARELYQSQLFKLARAYAELSGHRWVILSALHNVLQPDELVKPYDCRMPTTQRTAECWRRHTAGQLLSLRPNPTRFVQLCGRDYWCNLTSYMSMSVDYPNGNVQEYPLDGLGIGKRLQWFKQQIQTLQEAPRGHV